MDQNALHRRASLAGVLGGTRHGQFSSNFEIRTLSYWAGIKGENPMRYTGGLLGGSWLTALTGDLGAGKTALAVTLAAALIEVGIFERDFGLRVALNVVDPTRQTGKDLAHSFPQSLVEADNSQSSGSQIVL